MTALAYEEYKQKIHLSNLGFILAMPIVIDFFSVIVQQAGMSGSSVITLALYVLSLLFILFRLIRIVRSREFINDLLLYILLLTPFALNYFWFEDTRAGLIAQEMLIIYFFYFLLSVLSIRKIYRWDLFFDALLIPGKVAISLAVFILLFLNYEKYLVYMGFSYALLPFICNFYRAARIEKKTKEKISNYLFFLFGMISILIFGARAAVAFAAAYIIVFEILRNDSSLAVKFFTLFSLSIVAFLLYTNIENIAEALIKTAAFKDSYLLKNLLAGRLFESKTRDILYKSCIRRISTMGFAVSGFLGDRKYCAGFAYPHNIFLEWIMSFGWVLGIVVIVFYSALLIKGVFSHDTNKRDVMVFIMISMLARYVISGSYLTEGKFWVVTTLVLGIALRNKNMETSDAE